MSEERRDGGEIAAVQGSDIVDSVGWTVRPCYLAEKEGVGGVEDGKGIFVDLAVREEDVGAGVGCVP